MSKPGSSNRACGLIRRILMGFALVVTVVGSAAAQTPLSPREAFALSITRQPDGDVAFNWAIAPGHYLYRDHTVATAPGGQQALALTLAPGDQKDDPGFGKVDVWHDRGQAILGAAVLDGAGNPKSVNITYQGCLEDSICYPPMTQTVALPAFSMNTRAARVDPALLVSTEADVQTASAASALALKAGSASVVGPGPSASSPAASAMTSASLPRASPTPAITLQSGGGLVERLADQGGAAWVLSAFFGFGILLAFTPCVFPMYPILAGVIGRGVDAPGGKRGFALSSAYVLGLATAFALLGAAAAWSGQNLQMALQSPWAVGALSLVFVALALSMFGLYELQLPSAWTSRLSGPDEVQGRRTLPSAAGLGFVSALIVGPCVTAPLAGALLYIAQTGDLLIGAAALFALGLGKGVPLILFGTLGARFLPRAGPWMDRVKTGFGLLFLITAWWLSSRILPPTATLALAAALSLLVATAFGLFRPLAHEGLWTGTARAAGLAVAVWAVLLLVGVSTGATDPWRPLAPLAAGRTAGVETSAGQAVEPIVVEDTAALTRAVQSAGAVDRAALVYFTADWCVSCKVIDRTVFADPVVQARLAAATLIEVDVTQTTPETRRLLEDFAVVGPPSMIFLDTDAREPTDSRLIGEMNAKDVIAALDRAENAT